MREVRGKEFENFSAHEKRYKFLCSFAGNKNLPFVDFLFKLNNLDHSIIISSSSHVRLECM